MNIKFDDKVTVSRHFEYVDDAGRFVARGIETTTIGESPSAAAYSVHTGSTCHGVGLSLADAFALVEQLASALTVARVAQQVADAEAMLVALVQS
jgi:hypothetical protein